MREKQVEKRFTKIKKIFQDLPKPQWFGPKNSKTVLVGWGSVKGPVIEALKNSKKNVSYCHVPVPYPIDEKLLSRILKGKEVIVIENNYVGQLANIIQESLGQKFDKRMNKYNGRQFFPEEIKFE